MNSDWFVLKFSGYNRAKDISVTTCEVLQQDSKPKLYKCINDNDDNNAIQISNEASQKLILNQDGFYKVRLYILNLTAVFFESGAMPVPTKLGNPTISGWGDPFHSYLTHS